MTGENSPPPRSQRNPRVSDWLEYPPTVEPDGSLSYEGIRYPKETGWHERGANPMKLEIVAEPCDHRQMTLTRRCCGNALVTMVCGCEACPIYGQKIIPNDCLLCKHGCDTGKPIQAKVLT